VMLPRVPAPPKATRPVPAATTRAVVVARAAPVDRADKADGPISLLAAPVAATRADAVPLPADADAAATPGTVRSSASGR